MLHYYKNAAKRTTLWGPTYFEHVLKNVKRYMEANLKNKIYHILLILTDGSIHDLRKTIDLVVQCSVYPLSIIIVGIGDDDFAAME